MCMYLPGRGSRLRAMVLRKACQLCEVDSNTENFAF